MLLSVQLDLQLVKSVQLDLQRVKQQCVRFAFLLQSL